MEKFLDVVESPCHHFAVQSLAESSFPQVVLARFIGQGWIRGALCRRIPETSGAAALSEVGDE